MKKCKIKDTIQNPDIWFNELFNLNFKFNRIKEKCVKYEDKLKTHVSEVSTEGYNPVRASCYFKILKIVFKYLKKEISWFWKTDLNVNKAQGKTELEEKFIELNAG